MRSDPAEDLFVRKQSFHHSDKLIGVLAAEEEHMIAVVMQTEDAVKSFIRI